MDRKDFFEQVETFEELYELIESERKWAGGLADWATDYARNAFIRLRRKYTEFDIPKARHQLSQIQDDCTDAIRIIHKTDKTIPETAGIEDVQTLLERLVREPIGAPIENKRAGERDEKRVRIIDAMEFTSVSHKTIATAARLGKKDGGITSKRTSTAKNSPYLVLPSEVIARFGAKVTPEQAQSKTENDLL